MSMNAIVTISHVCKFWRNVSLTSPALWTDINLHHQAANTFLARSVNQPLRLYLLNSPPALETRSSRGTNLGSHDGKRVRELVLRADKDCMEDVIDHLGQSFPELVVALLHLEQLETGDSFVFNASNVLTPKLRVLRTSNIDITDSLSIHNDKVPGQLSGLTFLELSDTDPDIYPSEDIIPLIQRCPSLEFFHFDEQNLRSGLVPFLEDVVITLDHLKGFYLRDFHFTKLLFRHIRIPAHAPLFLEVNPKQGDWGDSVLEVDYPNEVIKFGRGIYTDGRKPHFVTHLKGVPNGAEMASLIPMLGMILDFSKISKLTIKCRSDEDESPTWRELFPHFPLLQSLRIIADKACTNNVLTALWTSPIPCPGLDSLYLECGPRVNKFDWLERLFDLRSSLGLPLLKKFIIKATPMYPKGYFARWANSVDMEISVRCLTSPE